MAILNSIDKVLNIITGSSFVGKASIAIGSLFTAYIAPVVGLLATCFACSAVDMIYGIKVAKKQGKKITSRKNWKGTLQKIRDEFVLILLAHSIEFTVLGDSAQFVLSGGITVIITITELWSIIENLNTIDPDGPWKVVGKFLRKKGEEYAGIDIKNVNDDNTIKNGD